MSRFGPLTAIFFDPDDLANPLSGNKQPVSAWTEDYRDAEGSSSLTFVNDTDLTTLAAVGNICYAYKSDSVRDDLSPSNVTFAEPFIIRSRVAGPSIAGVRACLSAAC